MVCDCAPLKPWYGQFCNLYPKENDNEPVVGIAGGTIAAIVVAVVLVLSKSTVFWCVFFFFFGGGSFGVGFCKITRVHRGMMSLCGRLSGLLVVSVGSPSRGGVVTVDV